MFNKSFWKEATERALKTGAQFVLVTLGVGLAAGAGDGETAEVINALTLDWLNLGGVFLGGAFVSYLFSLFSAPIGEWGSPSLVEDKGKHEA